MENTPAPNPVHTNTQEDPGKGLGIASLILSLIGLHLIALILGIIGYSQSKKVQKTNGMAIAGIIISLIGMVVGTIFIIALVLGAGKTAVEIDKAAKSSTTTTTSSSDDSSRVYKFAERADKQSTDIEVLPGVSASIRGMQMTVDSVEYKASLGDFETADSGKVYLVVKVSLSNNGTSTKAYSQYDFRVQTASGQVLDPTFAVSLKDTLNSADLVMGGKVSGIVVFLLPEETTHQYIIWKPGFESDRVIIQAK